MIKLTKGNLLKSDAEALVKEKKDTHFLIEIFGCPVLFWNHDCVTKPSAVIMLATSSSQNVGTDLEGSATARNEML